MAKKKFVYFYGKGKGEGNGRMKEILGGKGASLPLTSSNLCIVKNFPFPANSRSA